MLRAVATGASSFTGILAPSHGGTGVANADSSTITLGGALATSGAFGLTLTLSALTNVTMPTTGTLATLAGPEALSNKTITAFGGALTFNPANANFTLSPTGTGTGAIAPATAGTINNMVIGGVTPLAGTFTALAASSPSVISVDSASAALRVTQIGAGLALLVEDSANPDSTPFVVDANGIVIVGALTGISPAGDTPMLQSIGDNSNAGVGLSRFSNNGGAARFYFAKSRSGTIGTNTVVASGDALGDLRFTGADGTGYILAAQITAAVDGTPGTNDMPGRLVFSTTLDGAAAVTERMRIQNSGVITLGAGTADSSLRVTPTASSANFVDIAGAVANGSPTFSAAGTDSNPSLAFAAKGVGVIRLQSLLTIPQATPATKTSTTTLTAAEILAGLILANPGGAANVNYTLPLGSDLEAALPADFGTDRAFFFSINNISTVVTETVTLLGNTNTTLSGGGGVLANSAVGVVSSARFEVRRTASGVFTIYRT